MANLLARVKRLLNKGKFGYLAKNSLYFTISSFGSKLLAFLLIPLYTNVLSTAEMGLADIVVTTSSLLVYAVTLCVGDAIFIFVIDKANEKQPILKYGISVVFKGILVFSVGLTAFACWNPISWPISYYLFLWLHLTLTAFISVISSYLRAIDKIKQVAISGLVTTAVTIGSNLLLLLVAKMGVSGYLVSLTIGLAAELIYLIINCDGLHTAIKGALCDKRIQHEMLKYSIPLIINGVSWWVNSGLDRYLIIAISGMESNGIYSVSSKISTILSTLNTIFAQAWAISAIKEFDKEDTDGFFGKAYTGYNACLLICSSILLLINVPLARILYAKEFFVAWKSSSWLIISVLFNSMASFVGSIFGAVKDSRAYALSTIGAAALNVMLNIILIPSYQEVGAAIATASSFFVLWLIRYIYSRKYIHWKIKILRDLCAYALLIVQVILGSLSNHKYLLQIICIIGLLLLYSDLFYKFLVNNLRRKSSK